MKFRALSKFNWKGKSYEAGDFVMTDDSVIANRMVSSGLMVEASENESPPAEEESKPEESAAPNVSKKTEPDASAPQESTKAVKAPRKSKTNKKKTK